MDLLVPPGLSPQRRTTLEEVARRNLAAHGAGLLGLVLSGSLGRGIATERSDVDVYVVLSEEALGERRTTRSPALDEIPVTLTELEHVPEFGTPGWWFRWSFAWAPVLLDRSDGRLGPALRRQATVTAEEAESILVHHRRLDGYLNYAYRALKSDRDGLALERRLDCAESVPWLLDVVFTLAGRVRPYHRYLPWELTEHPLQGWPADELLPLVRRTLDGDPAAVRETFRRVELACASYDESRSEPTLTGIIADWGTELDLLRR
jgi:hypothetical protein